MIDGELITSYYFDEIAKEIEEALQTTGELRIAELAIRFSLDGEVIEGLINKKLGSIIHGQIKGGTLYTNAAVSRIQARIRGLFSAVTRSFFF